MCTVYLFSIFFVVFISFSQTKSPVTISEMFGFASKFLSFNLAMHSHSLETSFILFPVSYFGDSVLS